MGVNLPLGAPPWGKACPQPEQLGPCSSSRVPRGKPGPQSQVAPGKLRHRGGMQRQRGGRGAWRAGERSAAQGHPGGAGRSRARDALRDRAASGSDSPLRRCPAPPVTGTDGIALTGHSGWWGWPGLGRAPLGPGTDPRAPPAIPALCSLPPQAMHPPYHIPASNAACTALILVPEWNPHPSQHSWGGI